MRVVVIGNGVAGIEAALELRRREPELSITIVSEESDHHFSRTALMWVFTGQLSHRCIEPFERDLYSRMGFERVRARATGVDVENKKVTLAGGLPPLPYDKLLIACGSRARGGPWPGSDLDGIGHFVSLQDLEWLELEAHAKPPSRPPRADAHLAATADASPYKPRRVTRPDRGGKPPKNPAVIGGGLIGIEAIEVMASLKLNPHFFIREDWFWPIALDAAEGRWISDRMSHHGVQVHLQEDVKTLEGSGRIERITTDKGAYDIDLLVIAIGVMPNTSWLEDSGIPMERGGILVDRSLKTEVDDIYAAGDCASVYWFNGVRRPEQLWYTARDQGRMVARSILGDQVHYDRGLWYNSAKLMDIEWTTAGLVNMNVEDQRNWTFEEEGSVKSSNRIVLSGERVVGFNLLGRRWDHEVLLRFIRERRPLDYVLEHLNEARFDTEFVPPLRIPKDARQKTPSGPAFSLMPSPVKAPLT
ncbi:MAG: NAD(P)/FAD-dependent oxidoreductase [Myxococcota bacterium]